MYFTYKIWPGILDILHIINYSKTSISNITLLVIVELSLTALTTAVKVKVPIQVTVPWLVGITNRTICCNTHVARILLWEKLHGLLTYIRIISEWLFGCSWQVVGLSLRPGASLRVWHSQGLVQITHDIVGFLQYHIYYIDTKIVMKSIQYFYLHIKSRNVPVLSTSIWCTYSVLSCYHVNLWANLLKHKNQSDDKIWCQPYGLFNPFKEWQYFDESPFNSEW